MIEIDEESARAELLRTQIIIAAEPLVRFLERNFHPHHAIIIQNGELEVLEGKVVIRFNEDEEFKEKLKSISDNWTARQNR